MNGNFLEQQSSLNPLMRRKMHEPVKQTYLMHIRYSLCTVAYLMFFKLCLETTVCRSAAHPGCVKRNVGQSCSAGSQR